MPAELFSRLSAILEIVFAIAARRLQAEVLTTIGAEELPVHPGLDILIADDLRGVCGHTIRLLGDPIRREELRRTARELVTRTYSWDTVVQPFESELQSIARSRIFSLAI